MNKAQKYKCKSIVRDALRVWKDYEKFNVPTHSERSLFLATVSLMIDHFPGTTTYQRFRISEYVVGILERIIEA